MAFENSNREYTLNALSYKAIRKVKWLSWQDRLTVPLQPQAPCLSATVLEGFSNSLYIEFSIAKISMFIEPGNLIQSM